jgi:hypothetical protein
MANVNSLLNLMLACAAAGLQGPAAPALRGHRNRLDRRFEPVLLDNQNATTDVDTAYISASTEQRQHALLTMRDRFDRMTMHKEVLQKAVEHEIRASTLAAARVATGKNGTAHINASSMEQAAHQAFLSFKNASEAWERTRNVSREIEMSEEAFSDPKATISQIEEGLGETNAYIDRSAAARLEVRWGKTASTVAGDVAAAAEKRSEDVDSQVRTAQDRAMKAKRMTSTNSGILDLLDKLVADVEKSAEAVSAS